MITSAAKFKAECLHLIDHVHDTHEEIIVTKRGKPMARLVPLKKGKKPAIFGCMAGSVTYMGDIISPIDVDWGDLK